MASIRAWRRVVPRRGNAVRACGKALNRAGFADPDNGTEGKSTQAHAELDGNELLSFGFLLKPSEAASI